MKHLTLLLLACIVLFQHCASHRELAIVYPTGLTPDSQAVFAEHFRKGHVLYDLNCAKCHTQQVEGKAVIPDFSIPQLMDYAMRFEYPAHEEDLREVNVSIPELDDIQLFLRYKEPSGVWAFPERMPKGTPGL